MGMWVLPWMGFGDGRCPPFPASVPLMGRSPRRGCQHGEGWRSAAEESGEERRSSVGDSWPMAFPGLGAGDVGENKKGFLCRAGGAGWGQAEHPQPSQNIPKRPILRAPWDHVAALGPMGPGKPHRARVTGTLGTQGACPRHQQSCDPGGGPAPAAVSPPQRSPCAPTTTRCTSTARTAPSGARCTS